MKKSVTRIASLVTAFCAVVALHAGAQEKISTVVNENFQNAEKVNAEWKLNKRNTKWVDGRFIVAELGGAVMKSALPDSFTLTLEITPEPPKDLEKAKQGWTGCAVGSTIFLFTPTAKNSARAVYTNEDGKRRSKGVVRGGDLGELGVGKVVKYQITRTRNMADKEDTYVFTVNGVSCGTFETPVPADPKNDCLQLTSFRWSSQYNNLVITPAKK